MVKKRKVTLKKGREPLEAQAGEAIGGCLKAVIGLFFLAVFISLVAFAQS